MPEILDGRTVGKALTGELVEKAKTLKERGLTPLLAIVRLGERSDDLAYEKGAISRCQKVGIDVRRVLLAREASQEEVLKVVRSLNDDPAVHGILIFLPLPKGIDQKAVCESIAPQKDVDGISPVSQATVYNGLSGIGYPPCTAQACLEILKYYRCELVGKKVVVLGRSQVIGKPVSMLLLAQNATVTICHSKTQNLAAEAKRADILISALGHAGMVDKQYLRSGQTVIDVGINLNAEGQLCGDVNWEDGQVVSAITPVPGGVGSVTTTVLAKHVLEATEQLAMSN
ncbi:MAG: bifunctional 5,10-methylene-tetrahydrofolate dehydrogenase/5,10-methylene-tetrahydrofolate cyclohydrolase [bacterium]|nr:bifunctional 5,10-methylene-tetrahydrofolate dehydrogenase/5,10-methylene-tetrahydrofolate cyclohydrolase [bacterium]